MDVRLTEEGRARWTKEEKGGRNKRERWNGKRRRHAELMERNIKREKREIVQKGIKNREKQNNRMKENEKEKQKNEEGYEKEKKERWKITKRKKE